MKKTREPVARNRAPILEVLRAWLPASGTLLELASGSGEHAVYFANALPNWRFQPSDRDPAEIASIEAWRADGPANLLPPAQIDAASAEWGVEPVDAVVAINLVHIAPWSVARGLMAGAARVLRPDGLLFTYGPYRVGGEHTAPSNVAFDAWLRERDPAFGVRDVEALQAEAAAHGLVLAAQVAMPANNFVLVFRRH